MNTLFRTLKRQVSALLLAAGMVAFAAAPAFGSTIFATGFESPTYTVGNLAGQDGWLMFGTATTVVENTFAKSGTQAVRVDGSSTAGQSGPFHVNVSAAQLIEMSADIFLSGTTNDGGWQFAALGAGLTPFAGGIDVSSTGVINLITSGFTSAGTFTRNTWHNVDFLFNYTTQRYSFTLDGLLVASNIAFCGDNGPCTGGPVSGYADVLFDTFGGNHSDVGFIDNLRVEAVPEPATGLLFGTGVLGMLWARRRVAR